MISIHALLLVVCFVAGQVSSSSNAGFKTRITKHALDYASNQAIDALAAIVPKASIPDQSGRSGKVEYTLKNIRITGFNKPSSKITIVPGTGLNWSAANAGISLHADWRVKYKKGWIHVSTSGSLDVSANGVSFGVTMAMGSDPAEKPSIRAANCRCNVGGVSIHIHGDIAFILNLFKHEVEKKVRDMIPGKLCDAVNQQINSDAENQLKKLNVEIPLLDKLFTLDYRLVSPPSFQTPYMETYHKGEITWTKKAQNPPFSPTPFPESTPSSNMLYLWIGKYVPQSFLFAAQNNGFLQSNMTETDLPPKDRGFLNTTCNSMACIGNLFPMVSKMYPNCTLTLNMVSTNLPTLKMTPGELGVGFEGEIAVYVNTLSGKTPFCLSMSVSAIFNLTANIENELLKGKVRGSHFKAYVKKSAVGPLKDKAINAMIGLVMKFYVIPQMNNEGEKGFPLLFSHDFQMMNSQLLIFQDVLMIGTDFKYTPHFKRIG